MLEFVDDINNYRNRVLNFDTGKLYEEISESVKLAEDIKTICIRGLLHSAL